MNMYIYMEWVKGLARNIHNPEVQNKKDGSLGTTPASATWTGDDDAHKPLLFQDQKGYHTGPFAYRA
jgi:hypothetical protein